MALADTIKDFLIGVGFDVDEQSAGKAESVINTIDEVVRKLGDVLVSAGGQIKGFLSGVTNGSAEISNVAGSMDAAADAAAGLSENELRAAQDMANVAESAGKAATASKNLADSQIAATDAADGNAVATRGASNAADALAQAAQKTAKSLGDSSAAAQKAATASGTAASTSKQLTDAQDKLARNSEKAAKGLDKANESAKMEGAKKGTSNVSGLEGQLQKVTDTIKRFVAAAVTMFIGSGIKSAISDAISFSEELVQSAKQLGKTTEEARAYNMALKAMGKTADEIKNSKALTKTFEDLQNIGKQLALPDGAAGLTMIHQIQDGFLQLRLTANYALQWLIYKVQTVAEGPLTEVRDMITGIREWFGSHVEEIATGIAKALGAVIQIFTSLITAVQGVIGWIDKLPPSIKIVGAVALAVIAAIHSKMFLITMIVGAILLLIDDFVTYMQGGDSLFGGFWGKLIEWVEKATPYIEAFIDYFSTGLEAIGSALGWLVDLLGL